MVDGVEIMWFRYGIGFFGVAEIGPGTARLAGCLCHPPEELVSQPSCHKTSQTVPVGLLAEVDGDRGGSEEEKSLLSFAFSCILWNRRALAASSLCRVRFRRLWGRMRPLFLTLE